MDSLDMDSRDWDSREQTPLTRAAFPVLRPVATRWMDNDVSRVSQLRCGCGAGQGVVV